MSINQKSLPLLATRGLITFPKFKSSIDVGRTTSMNAIHLSIDKYENKIIVVSQKNSFIDKIDNSDDLFNVGTLATIKIDKPLNDNNGLRVEISGISRVKIKKVSISSEILKVDDYDELLDIYDDEVKINNMKHKLFRQLEETISTSFEIPKAVLVELSNSSSSELADVIGQYMPLDINKRQTLLETTNVFKRLELASTYVTEEKEINKIEKTLDKNVKDTLDEQQREFLLRERLKAIKEQLGEISSKTSEIDDYAKKIKEGKYPKYVVDVIEKEIKRYESMPPISAEANVSKAYIETILDLPWWQKTKDNENILEAKKILDEHHYGLEKVKERIIEYLAIKSNTKSSTTPIITLVGPPGIGKTSMVKSIAKALDRKYVKISLGGVKDESEIRGHRRTYVGAMPGKIVKAIQKSGVVNPLILLDEIDKMSSDYKGDPTSAMLEVLDPEQNKSFQDHYLELEYDLSNVIFVATANYFKDIPSPLLDRVELIELSSYTELEKIEIAKKHLIPNVIKESGLKRSQFKVSDKILLQIIRKYTLEAGVRDLKRTLDKIARKLVVKKLTSSIDNLYTLTETRIREFLGPEKIEYEKLGKKSHIGTVTGLAYTSYGGSILPIEVTIFPGEGNLKLTGQLKDVMKESASIALGFVKANADKFKIDFEQFKKNDIHIHVPEGAVPKDGPSAGVTFTTALISALTNTPIPQKIGMTGEITLRGHVLEIGGLKEKSISALRSGIETIFIPKTNIKNLEDLPKEVTESLKIIPVEKYSEIYESLF